MQESSRSRTRASSEALKLSYAIGTARSVKARLDKQTNEFIMLFNSNKRARTNNNLSTGSPSFHELTDTLPRKDL
jgi:hypothetical protein